MLRRIISLLFGSPIVPGSVVVDRYDGVRKTVERVNRDFAYVVWFEGSHLRRGRLLVRNLTIA